MSDTVVDSRVVAKWILEAIVALGYSIQKT
jgi:hypothetical protein